MRHPLSSALSSLLIFTSTLCWASAAQADEEARDPLSTDRPDVANSSLTVGKGVFQIEAGLEGTYTPSDAQNVIFPTKLRLGLSDTFEAHLEGNIYQLTTTSRGVAPLDVGGKWHLNDGEGWSLGLLFALTFPLQQGDTIAFSPTLAAEFELGAGFALGTNLGATLALSPRLPQSDAARFAASFSRGWTDRLSTFLEGFGQVSFLGDAALGANVGFLFKFTPDFQIDAYLRHGLYQSSGLTAGSGLSYRF